MELKNNDVSFTSCAIPQQTVTQPIFNPLKKTYRCNTHHINSSASSLLGEVQVVVEPLPRLNLGNAQTRGAVSEWCEEEEAPNQSGDNDTRGSPGSEQRLSGNALPNGLAARFLGDGLAALFGNGGNIGRLEVEDELDQSACHKCAGEVRW